MTTLTVFGMITQKNGLETGETKRQIALTFSSKVLFHWTGFSHIDLLSTYHVHDVNSLEHVLRTTISNIFYTGVSFKYSNLFIVDGKIYIPCSLYETLTSRAVIYIHSRVFLIQL